jgi:hypothetical protein
MQMVELMSSMQMNASCMRMSACAQQEMWAFGCGQMWCGVCGHATREALSTGGILYSKGQWMLWHIVSNHDLAALFEIQNSDWSTTMDIVRTQFPGLIKEKS